MSSFDRTWLNYNTNQKFCLLEAPGTLLGDRMYILRGQLADLLFLRAATSEKHIPNWERSTMKVLICSSMPTKTDYYVTNDHHDADKAVM